MTTRTYHRWKVNAGSIDTLNTFFIPELTENGIPRLNEEYIIPPNKFYSYKVKTELNDYIHFFLDDYRFEHIWKNPELHLYKFLNRTVCTPDFSVYIDHPLPLQIFNTYRNRWVGAFWQTKGIHVIPTIEWGDERSYDFCFDGVDQDQTVIISPIGCLNFKENFVRGFNEMIKRLDPKWILCYGKLDRYPVDRPDNLIEYGYNWKTRVAIRI